MERHVVAGFRPSRHGFHFPNRFPKAPVLTLRLAGRELPLGDASGGLCGGMVHAVRDLFECGRLPPHDREVPAVDSPLFRWICRRLIHSFRLPLGPLRYGLWTAMPDRGNALFAGINDLTLRHWVRTKQELGAGRLVPLGLVRVHSWDPRRVPENHQILAYGYEVDQPARWATLFVYDPNHPDDDELTLTVDLTGRESLQYSDGQARGFFRSAYRCYPIPLDLMQYLSEK